MSMRGYMFLVCLSCFIQGFTQANLLSGKRVGIYISNTRFDLPESYFMSAAQFLSQGENRSGSGDLKSELIIRLGVLFCRRVSELSDADTVIFLNASPEYGRSFLNSYDATDNKLKSTVDASLDVDFVVVLNKIELSMRSYQAVIVRSNRMYTEKVPVKMGVMEAGLFDPQVPDLVIHRQTCIDEQKDAKVFRHFDMYTRDSSLGNFFSLIFSKWWDQMLNGIETACTP